MGGYLFIAIVLLAVWVIAFFVFDRRIYIIVAPGQVTVCLAIGDAESSYDATGAVSHKVPSDLFRHWILGMGSGDLEIRTSGSNAQSFQLHNVLGISSKLKLIQDLLRPPGAPPANAVSGNRLGHVLDGVLWSAVLGTAFFLCSFLFFCLGGGKAKERKRCRAPHSKGRRHPGPAFSLKSPKAEAGAAKRKQKKRPRSFCFLFTCHLSLLRLFGHLLAQAGVSMEGFLQADVAIAVLVQLLEILRLAEELALTRRRRRCGPSCGTTTVPPSAPPPAAAACRG